MATVKKHKNVYERIDAYQPADELTKEALDDYGFLFSSLGDAVKTIELSDNPFVNYTLDIMIDLEDISRSQNYVMDGIFKEFPLENDTPEMNEVRASVFGKLDMLVEDGILQLTEDIEVIAPTYRKKKG